MPIESMDERNDCITRCLEKRAFEEGNRTGRKMVGRGNILRSIKYNT
jgi:hypothetical protein